MALRKKPTVEESPLRPVPLPGFRLVGGDGNAFSIMGRFISAAKREGIDKPVIDAVLEDAKSGDYDHLLGVFIPWEDEEENDDE